MKTSRDRDNIPGEPDSTGAVVHAISEFLRLEAAGGILLFIAAVLALVSANSPASSMYDALLEIPIEIRVSELRIAKPMLLWINDGLMAVFFLLVGLEIKREFLDGELADPARILLPAAAAVGGMAVPALVYAWFNLGNSSAMSGWAIPSATDIAFALGVLALFGRLVPLGLKLFLLMLAILDDLGAIIIIAVYYSGDLSTLAFTIAGMLIIALAVMNWRAINTTTPYLVVGVLLWIAVLKSGVHATLAGTILALFVPLNRGGTEELSPLRQLEKDLHPTVAYVILPVFAFANAGVSFEGITPAAMISSVPAGIAAGLFLGKQAGIMAMAWLCVKLRLARLPDGVNWRQLYGAALLCGIGFTMSLFIGSLAFEHGGPDYATDVRIGILMGSSFSGIVGYLVLRHALQPRKLPEP
jgi:NhaA family Na+:H+ antiporter